MTIPCPHCRESIWVDASDAGSQLKCPRCGGVFTAPTSSPQAPRNDEPDAMRQPGGTVSREPKASLSKRRAAADIHVTGSEEHPPCVGFLSWYLWVNFFVNLGLLIFADYSLRIPLSFWTRPEAMRSYPLLASLGIVPFGLRRGRDWARWTYLIGMPAFHALALVPGSHHSSSRPVGLGTLIFAVIYLIYLCIFLFDKNVKAYFHRARSSRN